MWRTDIFPQGGVEENLLTFSPQEFLPHSTIPVDKFLNIFGLSESFVSGASGGYLSCFGKKDTKEADQGVTRAPARDAVPLGSPRPVAFGAVKPSTENHYRTETFYILTR